MKKSVFESKTALCRHAGLALLALAMVAIMPACGGGGSNGNTPATTPVSVVSATLPDGAQGSAYSQNLNGTGGTPPYTWTLVSGTLPAGVTLSSAGILSGTPTNNGTFTFSVGVTDSKTQNATGNLTLKIQPPVAVTTTTVTDGNKGTAFTLALAQSGGVGPYTWTVTAGALPAGATLSTSGTLSGTPTANGLFNFTVQVTDATGGKATKALQWLVHPLFQITDRLIYGAIVQTSYSFTMSTAEGQAPITWALDGGTSLPPGLSLSASTGVISGIPTQDGTFTVSLKATSSDTQTHTKTFVMYVSRKNPLVGNDPLSDPYAGGGPDANATLLSSCPGTALSANTSYRLTADIGADPLAICLDVRGPNLKLDLGGHKVTGAIVGISVNPSNMEIFNGQVECHADDGSTRPGCINISAQLQPTAPVKIHHLTVHNAGTDVLPTYATNGTRAVRVSWSAPTAVTGASTIRMYNITATVDNQRKVSRSHAIEVTATNHIAEVSYNNLTCAGTAGACQGIVCFGTIDCKMHGNRIALDVLDPDVDKAGSRGLVLDRAVDGEVWNNTVVNNESRSFRVRDSTNLRIHDNTVTLIASGNIAAVHMGDPDGGVDDLQAVVERNSFEVTGGTVLFVRSAKDLEFRNNTIVCAGCTGLLADVRTPNGTACTDPANDPNTLPGRLCPQANTTEANLTNNPTATLLPSPQIKVSPGATVRVCNTGTAGAGPGGLGTIVTITCP